MKKILSILLLVIMFVNTIGLYLVYRHNLSAIRQQMRASINAGTFPVSKLTTIGIDITDKTAADEFQILDDHELQYRGKMYDIVNVKKDGGKLVFSCIQDKQETELISNFFRVLQTESGKQTGKSLGFVKYPFSDFMVTGAYCFDKNTLLVNADHATLFLSPILIRHRPVAAPPPW